jgi:hypothetical protein
MLYIATYFILVGGIFYIKNSTEHPFRPDSVKGA